MWRKYKQKRLTISDVSMYVTFDIVLDNPNENWNFPKISSNPNITEQIIEKYPSFSWCRAGICRNPSISLEFIKDYPKHLTMYSPNITPEYIDNFEDKGALFLQNPSSSSNIPLDYISKNLDLDWNWEIISMRKDITFEMIQSRPNLPWNWNRISINPNITIEIVKKHPECSWNFGNFTRNKSVTFEMYKKNKDIKWSSSLVCLNPNITEKIVKENPDFFWIWSYLLSNDYIEFDFAEKYKIKIVYNGKLDSCFQRLGQTFRDNTLRKYFAMKKIENWVRNGYTTP